MIMLLYVRNPLVLSLLIWQSNNNLNMGEKIPNIRGCVLYSRMQAVDVLTTLAGHDTNMLAN